MTASIAFDRAADYYDQTRGFPPGEELPAAAMLARRGGWNESSRILEIGVGTGRIALPLASRVAAIYGLDLSRPMMSRLRAKQAGEPIHLVEGDAAYLPFSDSVFDGTVIVHVLHLIPNWRDVLTELRRVLRPAAPLIHGWTEEDDTFRDLWDIFNEAIQSPERDYTPVGAPFRSNPNFLEDEGWRPVGEPESHTYTRNKTPNSFLQMVRERKWSALWRVGDDDLARGLEAAQKYLQEHYPNLDEPIPAHSTFHACAYLPPG
jgi:ubiquinone/menaquinone biosynthesis C-methylase UbiE